MEPHQQQSRTCRDDTAIRTIFHMCGHRIYVYACRHRKTKPFYCHLAPYSRPYTVWNLDPTDCQPCNPGDFHSNRRPAAILDYCCSRDCCYWEMVSAYDRIQDCRDRGGGRDELSRYEEEYEEEVERHQRCKEEREDWFAA